MKENTLADFQKYQLAFTNRIRNPNKHPMPKGVNADRMAVYESLIFNNLFESVSLCFPVAKAVLGKKKWEDLIRAYFIEYASNTPIFREIPETFLAFLSDKHRHEPLEPGFLLSLCHYEWVELALTTQAESPTPVHLETNITSSECMLDKVIWFCSPFMLLNYDYPVHTISKDNQPRKEEATQLFVYRDDQDEIQFVVLNAVTYQLLKWLIDDEMRTTEALKKIADATQQPFDTIQNFGLSFLFDFYKRGMIKGYIT